MPQEHPRSSRQRYRSFLNDYRLRRLDDAAEAAAAGGPADGTGTEEAAGDADGRRPRRLLPGRRREYLRDYLRWLRPHRGAVALVFLLALIGAGLQMVEPLFMRFIIDQVLLNDELASTTRLAHLHLAGGVFVGVIVLSKLIGVVKDYRQKQLNVRVMLSLRRSLFERLLHLPLQKLWEMKTGGILSRLTGDIDTTTGLLQMAIISPAISIIRLLIAVGVLMVLNWRLALTALAIIPGVMLMSFAVARRIRPIYRSVRK
ncbi:MAG TPA: ABC transporter ATP-binding protein, partial [Longimicrobiales bacterium]|nr:ABC transporter ATP-binding protein [Longimicrobiales bacterium]